MRLFFGEDLFDDGLDADDEEEKGGVHPAEPPPKFFFLSVERPTFLVLVSGLPLSSGVQFKRHVMN